MTKEELSKYLKTEKFSVIDTIGVPHPYCITEKHLRYNDTMILNVEEAERKSKEVSPRDPRRWAVCDICKKLNKKKGYPILPYSEHKQALLVEVNDERELTEIPELKDYLLSIKEMAEKDGFAGFAFKQK